MLQRLGVTLLCALLAYLVLGVRGEDIHATVDPAAQRALNAVTTATFDLTHPATSFPADYQQVMGYLPVVATGPEGTPILIKPTGDCSAFAGETQYRFGWVCKEHDLAYDVLRYSAAVGRPLPARSRVQADDMFRRELHNNCTFSSWSGLNYGICHFWAESFAVAVDINSWRQGYQPPRLRESVAQWDAFVVLFLVLLLSRRQLETMSVNPDDILLEEGRM